MSKSDLLEALDISYRQFLASFQDLNEADMGIVWYGDWSLKDIIAHIAGWHIEMKGALERIGRGERASPEGVDYSDIESWNRRFTAARRRSPPGPVVEELKAAHAALRNAAEVLPDERFETGRSGYRILTVGAEHYGEHGEEIQAWRHREKR